MSFITHRPSRPLSDVVSLIWFYKSDHVTSHPRERLLPTATGELIIDLGNPSSRPIVCGPHSNYFSIDTSQTALVLGVHFEPGGTFPFFKDPAAAIHNSHVSLRDLWGKHADYLHEQILSARSVSEMFQVIERALLREAVRSLEIHPAVDFALREFQAVPCERSIKELTEELGFSSRHFIQLFKTQVGMPPKLFCRVQRFQRVLMRLASSHQVDWSNIAASCGYYDQAHFIHEFEAFSGLTPSSYFRVRGEHLNHIPMNV